jgi:hypothetical protein
MQEITMLTPYLLTKFHDFSIYLISGTWNAIYNFSRELKGKITKDVSPWVSTDREGHVGPSPDQVGPKGGRLAPLWGQIDRNLASMLARRRQRGTDLITSVWPKFMAGRPAIHFCRTASAKSGNRSWDTINTPLCSTLQDTHPFGRFHLQSSSALV